MIDISREKPILVWPDAAELFLKQRNGKAVSRSTIYRRINKAGNPLEVIRSGGSLFTSFEAIQRWIERETKLSGMIQHPPSETPMARNARNEATKRRLLAHGIEAEAKTAKKETK